MYSKSLINKTIPTVQIPTDKRNDCVELCDNLINLLNETKKNLSNRLSWFRIDFKKSGDEKIRVIDDSISQLETIKISINPYDLNFDDIECKDNIRRILHYIKISLQEQRSRALFHKPETKTFSYFKNHYTQILELTYNNRATPFENN